MDFRLRCNDFRIILENLSFIYLYLNFVLWKKMKIQKYISFHSVGLNEHNRVQ